MTRKYNNTTRLAAKAVRQAARNQIAMLKAIEKELEFDERGRDDVSRTRTEYKREARNRKLPEDRKCPVCGKGPLRSRQFSVKPITVFRRFLAMCRPCSMKCEADRIAVLMGTASAPVPVVNEYSEMEYE